MMLLSGCDTSAEVDTTKPDADHGLMINENHQNMLKQTKGMTIHVLLLQVFLWDSRFCGH